MLTLKWLAQIVAIDKPEHDNRECRFLILSEDNRTLETEVNPRNQHRKGSASCHIGSRAANYANRGLFTARSGRSICRLAVMLNG
jgi:hypothetical protein